ncbi:hypothetical protein BDQ17DRAFT_128500 [Cyathus striatus]|nr:hypothetical protein BDQ17DRAFT_128500 [Cyathus striatus]
MSYFRLVYINRLCGALIHFGDGLFLNHIHWFACHRKSWYTSTILRLCLLLTTIVNCIIRDIIIPSIDPGNFIAELDLTTFSYSPLVVSALVTGFIY